MSDTPKFTVIDRRKFKAEEEEQESAQKPVVEHEPAPAGPSGGPHLVTGEGKHEAAHEPGPGAEIDAFGEGSAELPPAPTAQESREQKTAYDASAQRLEDLLRAQNPAMGAQPPVGFEHLVQQLYVSAMIQMGAGTQEGQRPRIDILAAKTTIDLIGVLAEKT